MTKTRRWLLVAGIVFLSMFTSPVGYISTIWACANDGGEKIFFRTYSDGYFYAPPANSCSLCEADILLGIYEFVDTNITRKHPLTDQLGFHRYALASIESASCDAWNSADAYAHLRKEYDRDFCLTLTPIDTPSNFVFQFERRPEWGILATRLSVTEARVFDSSTGEILGQYKHYGYVFWMRRLAEVSTFSHDCGAKFGTAFARDLRTTVLMRTTNKGG